MDTLLVCCEACSHLISIESKACVKCGHPVDKEEHLAKLKKSDELDKQVKTWGLAILLLAGAAYWIYSMTHIEISSSNLTSTKNVSPPKISASDSANKLCGAFMNTGLVEECLAYSAIKTIQVTINTNSVEARKICTGIVNQANKYDTGFGGKWKIQVMSLANNDLLAICKL